MSEKTKTDQQLVLQMKEPKQITSRNGSYDQKAKLRCEKEVKSLPTVNKLGPLLSTHKSGPFLSAHKSGPPILKNEQGLHKSGPPILKNGQGLHKSGPPILKN